MKDHLLKVLAFNDEVKAVAIVATEAVSQAQKRHDTWSAATAALGRTMIGTQLLATSLKGKEKITVQVNGDGPGGKIMAEANGIGQMRGYISNPHVSLPLNEKLPGASEETIVEIERRINEMPLVSKLIDQQEEPIDLLNRLLGKENIKVLEELPVEFHCPCTRERFSAGLLSIGVEDLQHLIDEDHGAEIVCHFCGEKYQFSEDDLNDLITEINAQK